MLYYVTLEVGSDQSLQEITFMQRRRACSKYVYERRIVCAVAVVNAFEGHQFRDMDSRWH